MLVAELSFAFKVSVTPTPMDVKVQDRLRVRDFLVPSSWKVISEGKYNAGRMKCAREGAQSGKEMSEQSQTHFSVRDSLI